MLKGQKIIKSVYFQLVRGLADGEENNLVVGLNSGGKDWVLDECRGVLFPFLVRELSVDRVLEWIIIRSYFFKIKL